MTRAKIRGLAPALAVALSLVLICGVVVRGRAATDVRVHVTFKSTPVPGATVTVSRDDARTVTTTDEGGEAHVALDEGTWIVRVEMLGFAPAVRDVTVNTAAISMAIALTMIAPDAPIDPSAGEHGAIADHVPTPAQPNSAEAATKDRATAADVLLVNGSTYNAAASPFAQSPAFGNHRPPARPLYSGSAGVSGGSSAWDARPYSFTSQSAPAPRYGDLQMAGTFGGPMKVPGVRWFRPLLTVSYAHSTATIANTISTRVPTTLERAGDFSATSDAGGPVTIVDPLTNQPFPDDTIPSARLSPQALALLAFYPAANVAGSDATNYQTAVTDRSTRDALQMRLEQPLTTRQQVSGRLSYQRAQTTSTSLFAFEDGAHSTDVDATVTWSYRASPTKRWSAHYELIGARADARPFFADRENISGDAGIAGNDQAPSTWGPPTLRFASGLAGLTNAPPTWQHATTHIVGGDGTWLHGYHDVSFGGEWRTRRVSSTSDTDPRGTFTFTGAATGDDFADFLLGLPHASTIAFGDPRVLIGSFANAYVIDDWHVAMPVTINAGVRWEYEGPLRERAGRMANLDLAPDLSAASVVWPGESIGAISGQRYPAALIDSDWRGVQPRVGVSWRPLAASTLVVRGGYGLYRQTDVYLPIAAWLATEPPFATVASLESTSEQPLTLADGFATAPGPLPNTLAVDPHLRTPYTENWQLSVQRDLPASLSISATYLGTRGHHLLQESLPDTVPLGAENPCPSCPRGFVYISSNGRSIRHALELQVRRRLRSGFTATVQYTLAEASDDATALAGVSAAGTSIAQDWSDLEAEWAPSAFDRRHLLSATFEYTTGVGTAGGGLLTGLRGALVKGWVFAGRLTAGSGLPITPLYLTSVPGTGITGTIRASVVGASAGVAPPGYFLDPSHYAAPAAGEWGTAGRNSARGPAEFSFDASVGRSFDVGHERTIEWRVDATNVLNRVTYADVNALVGSPQFGLPDRANAMRTLRMTLRWSF
jgi:hypothetical protein